LPRTCQSPVASGLAFAEVLTFQLVQFQPGLSVKADIQGLPEDDASLRISANAVLEGATSKVASWLASELPPIQTV
jgi:hypothetical protein